MRPVCPAVPLPNSDNGNGNARLEVGPIGPVYSVRGRWVGGVKDEEKTFFIFELARILESGILRFEHRDYLNVIAKDPKGPESKGCDNRCSEGLHGC